MRDVIIATRAIGPGHPPFVIAEMSGNHNHSLERALEIVDAAADAGAHAIKLQTYTADTITLDTDAPGFTINDPGSLWNGRRLHELYDDAHTPWEWHEAIFARGATRGLIVFSTPFDDTAVDFLEDLGAPCHKIASFENIDLPLIRRVARTGKPIIMSTGMASELEIAEAVEAIRSEGNDQIILLKCTSTYPARPVDTNLLTIPDLRERFGCQVGLSDHTLGTPVSVASVALGATVIEKHFTLARADGGVDSAFSLEPAEFATLVSDSLTAWEALGSVSYGPTEKELASLQFRRSLYVAEDIAAGEELTARNVRSVRPGMGLAPKHYDEVLGRRATTDLRKGTPLSWDVLA